MLVTPTAIPDVKLITPKIFEDDRGFFFENISIPKLADQGLDLKIVQENISRSSKGTLRGLHFQNAPHAQAKLVQVIAGEVFDVAVDIRPNSTTYGQWIGEYLSEDNRNLLYIPEGFAHGFYVLSDTADFMYKCSDRYAPETEGSIRWDDPTIGIDWPLIPGTTPALSPKDKVAPLFQQ